MNIRHAALTFNFFLSKLWKCSLSEFWSHPEAHFGLAGPWLFPFIYLFIGVLWIGGAVVLSASIRRSFFEGGPLAFAVKLPRLPNCIGEESANS